MSKRSVRKPWLSNPHDLRGQIDECLDELGFEDNVGEPFFFIGDCRDCGTRNIHCEYCCGCVSDLIKGVGNDKDVLHRVVRRLCEEYGYPVHEVQEIYGRTLDLTEYFEEIQELIYDSMDDLLCLVRQMNRENLTKTLGDCIRISKSSRGETSGESDLHQQTLAKKQNDDEEPPPFDWVAITDKS